MDGLALHCASKYSANGLNSHADVCRFFSGRQRDCLTCNAAIADQPTQDLYQVICYRSGMTRGDSFKAHHVVNQDGCS